MNSGVQRFYAAVEHLAAARDVFDQCDRNTGVAQGLSRPAGADDFSAEFVMKGACKINDAGFVPDADQRAANHYRPPP